MGMAIKDNSDRVKMRFRYRLRQVSVQIDPYSAHFGLLAQVVSSAAETWILGEHSVYVRQQIEDITGGQLLCVQSGY